MGLSHDDVREILRLIDESERDELHVETAAFSLHVRRAGGEPAAEQAAVAEPADPELPVPEAVMGAPDTPPAGETQVIASPMLGIFYRAGAPGAAPFVEVGAAVAPETTVCIIEVMKMMNSVPAGLAGTITEVCVENAALVEAGAPLFRVAPQ